MEIVDVPTGVVKARQGEYVLKASAIGSCVVVTAYDRENKIGGMAHVMLPGKAPDNKTKEKTRYAEDAIEELFNSMKEMKANIDNLEICLAGGGNVLIKEDDVICQPNIASVIELLAKRNLYAQAKALGGTMRRSMSLDTETGVVTYTEGNSSEKILLK